MPPRFPAGLRGQLAAFSFSRMILNTGSRRVSPFLPAIARGLGLDRATAALAVTARSATGLASPLLGFLADRYGRKLTMLAGLLTFAFGVALGDAWAIARGGWSAPFPFLAGLALVATAVLWRLLPADDRPSRRSLSPLKGMG